MLQNKRFLSALAICLTIEGCSSGARPDWGAEASYHVLGVASQYQQQLSVVVARVFLPGATADEIEATFAERLETAVLKMPGVKSVRSQRTAQRFLMEVHFNGPADESQLKEVQGIVDRFWLDRSLRGATPTVTMGNASILEVRSPQLKK